MNKYDIAKPEEPLDPIFSIDTLMGRILDALATIGLFCFLVAGCFFWGYWK